MNSPDLDTQDTATMLADSARDYLARGYTEAVRSASLAHPQGCSPDRWREFAELGWLALALPEADGGMGFGATEICAVTEALGSALVVEPVLPCAVLATSLAASLPPSSARSTLLQGLADGSRRIALAPWEAGVGVDAGRIRMRAEPAGTGWTLSGAKSVAPGGAGADAWVVAARIGDSDELGLFAVDAGSRGVQASPVVLYDGSHAARLALAGAPAALLLRGSREQVMAPLERALQLAIIAHSAETAGAAWRAFEITSDYLRTRKQFGKAIASNQVVQHRLVDLYVEIAELRALTAATASAFDRQDPELAAPVAALRALTAQVARHVWEESVQLHGAIGMTDEYIVGQYVKRLASACTLYGGAEEHLETLAALVLG